MSKTNKEILDIIKNSTTDMTLKKFLTDHPNIADLGNIITQQNYSLQRNALIDSIVNTLSMRIVKARIIQNQLKECKSGKLPFGATINEIMANPAISKEYDMTSTDLLKQTLPDVKSLYYTINSQRKYPVTISQIQLQRAILREGGLSELINLIVSTLYSGDNLEEQELMKQLIVNAYLNSNVKTTVFSIADTSTGSTLAYKKENVNFLEERSGEYSNGNTINYGKLAKDVLIYLKMLSNNFVAGNSKYSAFVDKSVTQEQEQNGTKSKYFTSTCPLSDQIIMIRNDILAYMDVEVLGQTFNLSKAELKQRVIGVDDFGGTQIICMLCDKAWWRVYDTLYQLSDFQNGSNLTTNYWLHHHQVLGYSTLAKGVVMVLSSDERLKEGNGAPTNSGSGPERV